MTRRALVLAAILVALPARGWDDSSTRSIPQSPLALPRVGALDSEPDFGTPIKRLLGTTGYPEYSNLQAWSKNQDRLLLHTPGYVIYNYPAMSVLRDVGATAPGATAVRWDPSDNDVIFFFKDRETPGSLDLSLYRMIVSTGAVTTVANFPEFARNCTDQALQEMSTDGKWISIVGTTPAGNLRTFAYDVKTATRSKYVETTAYASNGTPCSGTSCSCDYSYNWTMISPDGDYFLTQWNGKGDGVPAKTEGVEAYPIQSATGCSGATCVAAKAGQVSTQAGHADIIKDSSGQWFVYVDNADNGDICDFGSPERTLIKSRIPDGFYSGSTPPANFPNSTTCNAIRNSTVFLLEDLPYGPAPSYSSYGIHVSCRASSRYSVAPSSAYCVISTENERVPLYDLRYEQELFRLFMDSTTTTPHVNRMGHHRSRTDGARDGYWDQPHATLSRDGKRILFGSNWETEAPNELISPYVFTDLDDLPSNTWLKLNTVDRKISDSPNVVSQVASANSFSGAMYDEASKSYLNFGGGHWSYIASGVQRFDFDRIGWRQDYAPETANANDGCECESFNAGTTPPITPPRDISTCSPAHSCSDASHGRTPLGRPWAYHTYSQERCDSSGTCLMMGTHGDVWSYIPSTKTWTQLDPSSGDLPGCYFDANFGASFTYMPAQGQWLLVRGGTTRHYTYTGNPTAPFTSYSAANSPARGHSSAYVPISGGRVYTYGSWDGADSSIRYWDPAVHTWNTVTPTGDPPPSSVAAGMDWDETNQVLIIWSGGAALYKFNPVTRVGTRLTASGPTPPADGLIYGKFRYIKHLNIFAVVTSLSYARPDTTCMNTSTGPTETWVYRYAGSAPSQGSYCGNGLVETGESCDLGSFNGQATCPYGTPSCATCLNNCQTPGTGIGPYCGDGTIQSGDGEQCDPPGGSNFGGVTCQSLGFAGGSLVCSASCLRDTTNCGAPSAPPDPTNLHRTDKKP